ncbi:MAG: sulfite exporter TauE/SafE family protein [candidate division WS1 bacterium]|nr:sulfite exporter TauE/SafE family protein [candidate division WS1 bacterium]
MTKIIALLPGLDVGVLVGFLSGLLGIGGGVLMVPALLYLWKHDMQTAVGTSLAAMIPTALAGSVRHSAYGNVDWQAAVVLAAGAVGGAYLLGAPLAEHVPSELLKRIFGVVIVIFGLHMAGAGEWLVRLWR